MMKKLLLTLVGVICSLGMWADSEVKIFSEDVASSITGGITASTASVSAVFGVSTNADWKYAGDGKNFYTSDGKTQSTTTVYLTSTTNPSNGTATSVPTAGAFATFTPSKDGTLDVFIILNNGRAFFCLEKNGDALTPIDVKYFPETGSDGGTGSSAANVKTLKTGSSLATKYYGSVFFKVKKDCTYYLWCNSSKMGYYGWSFDTNRRPFTTVTDAASNQSIVLGNTSISSDKSTASYDNFTINGDNIQASNTKLTVEGTQYTSLKLDKKTYTISSSNPAYTISGATAYIVSNDNTKTNTIATPGTDATTTGNKGAATSPTSLTLAKNTSGLYEFTIAGDATQANVVVKVTYDVAKHVSAEVTDADYATFCYSEDVTIPSGVTAYTMAAPSGTTAALTEISGGKIKANTGVVLKADAGTYNFVTTTDAADMTSALTGVTATTLVTANAVSTLGTNSEGAVGLRTFTGTSVRAYSAYYAGVAGAKGFFNFDFGGVTAINNVAAKANANKADGKFFQNGKLVIVKNGKTYNAAGQQVK